jgi:hypothetical protein
MTKTRKQRKNKQHSLEIVAAEFAPVETFMKESLEAKHSRKRKKNQDLEMPIKPNRKTRITNQLRLNPKELFNPSLKDHQPIVIEDEDIEDDIYGFANMEEMVVHKLKNMTRDKGRMKYNEGETSGRKYATMKIECPADLDLEKNAMELGLDPEEDFDGITPDTNLFLEKVSYDSKPDLKEKTLKMQGSVKNTHDKNYEVAPRYEMRSRKTKFSIDLNKSSIEEEQGMKDRNEEQFFIKTNLKADKDVDENHQVQMMKQKIQTLQQQKKDMEMKHTKLQKKYRKLQKKHKKT